MNTHPNSPTNRRTLLKALALAGATAGGLAGLSRAVPAMGSSGNRQEGIYRLEGDVRFNGATRKIGDRLSLPLEVVTGKKSWTVFVLADNACLLRSESRLALTGAASNRPHKVALPAGKLLSVFGKGEPLDHVLPTAVAGVRGTGIYVESAAERAYVCLCYGTANLTPIDQPDRMERFSTRHHESPRWIYRDRMESAKVINHTDDELIMLESLVGRVPPFQTGYGYDDQGILSDVGRAERY